jgi:His/Glu/Gln/Arg/opine family amino acid ABC transporter permease subunit
MKGVENLTGLKSSYRNGRRPNSGIGGPMPKWKNTAVKIGIVITIILLFILSFESPYVNNKNSIKLFIEAFGKTIIISIIAIFMGLGLGIVIGLGRISRNFFIRGAASVYVEALRGTPLIIQIFFIYFGLPALGFNFSDPLPAAAIALGINSGAYQAEIIRGGIQSIPKGQMEAARSTGMSYLQSMRRVILPQGFRLIIPPLTNEYVTVIKDSSLAYTIGVVELTYVGNKLVSIYFDPFSIFLFVALIYFTLTTFTSVIMRFVEKRFQIPGYMIGGS